MINIIAGLNFNLLKVIFDEIFIFVKLLKNNLRQKKRDTKEDEIKTKRINGEIILALAINAISLAENPKKGGSPPNDSIRVERDNFVQIDIFKE